MKAETSLWQRVKEFFSFSRLQEKQKAKKKKRRHNKLLLFFGKVFGTGRDTEKTWRILRPVSITLISLVLVTVIVAISVLASIGIVFGPADKGNQTPVLFSVSNGATMSGVASKLKEAGLIRSSMGIKLLADFTSVSSKIQSGEYVLTKDMSAQEILDVITRPLPGAKVVTVTLVEGTTLEDFASALESAEVITSATSFLTDCKSIAAYKDYYFVNALEGKSDLRYALEGYLFPDTYEFYVGSSNQAVIKKLLSRLNDIYSPSYTESANALGLSMHEIMTLASMIEKEGRGEDFTKISAVFMNRLKKGMRLESDVTVQYALNVRRLVLTAEELQVASPYNTYVVSGLPVGPICNPGKKAIYAALHPDGAILSGGYLYFTLTDPYTGEVAYSKTYEEHVRIKNQYQSMWAEYDAKQGKNQ